MFRSMQRFSSLLRRGSRSIGVLSGGAVLCGAAYAAHNMQSALLSPQLNLVRDKSSWVEKTLFTTEEIAARVETLADQIAVDIGPTLEEGEQLLLVTVLKGSHIFAADLSRALTERGIPVESDFLCVSSYGKSAHSSGEVRFLLDLRTPISGRHVLLVEDIVDSGRTLAFLKSILSQRGPKKLSLCTMLHKPFSVVVPIAPDYTGFVLKPEDDYFLVGYGLDYAEQFRNESDISALKQSVYMKKTHNN